jgi:hypothetical protein
VFFDKPRDDLPRAAGPDAALAEALEGHIVTHRTVRLDQLFNRLVKYRNRKIGHGAVGQKRPAYYEGMGRALGRSSARRSGTRWVLTGASAATPTTPSPWPCTAG